MKIKKFAKNIFRGPKPKNPAELKEIEDKGVNTIICLEEGWSRIFGWSKEEQNWVSPQGKKCFVHVPMSNLFPPSFYECTFLITVLNGETPALQGPYYVHCYAGVDRTGFVLALWEVFQGKSPKEAWDSAQQYGMHKRYFWWKPYFLEHAARIQETRSVN